jgi:L-cysteine:1D-myo-inositol 2-amino-2-deoxy-alpha-D-glucopyranoside ligase
MQLYNALSQNIESFKPEGDTVTIYVCGITPYDTTHVGHSFTYASFDILIRYMEHLGYQVRYAQNVTDIDDDMLRRAGQLGEDWWSLGNRWTSHFINDNLALNMRPPEYFPRATDVIDEIISVVQTLVGVGVAYESNGSVYFNIAKDQEYGKLSRLSLDEMLPVANERGNNPDDPNKVNPLDFVLWQAQANGEPAWNSPWGSGRPGWHIECSTLSNKFLGQPIDIHGGGADLIFPHHESEIAQAEFSNDMEPFTRIWMHIAMVYYQGEKMSKSLGNLVMIRDLLDEGYEPDAIRLCLASHHYRIPWSFTINDLDRAAELAAEFHQAVLVEGGQGQYLDPKPTEQAFGLAMDDDLNAPEALQVLSDMARAIMVSAADGGNVFQAQEFLRNLAGIFGLRLDKKIEPGVVDGWRRHQRRFTDQIRPFT